MVLLNSFGKNTRVADAVRIRRWLESRVAAQLAFLAQEVERLTRERARLGEQLVRLEDAVV